MDDASGSRPEHETTAADAEVLATVLGALGAVEVIAFSKRCVNYRFDTHGREMLATVVQVPELAGRTFIELETAARPDDVAAALRAVRAVLTELGIETGDLATGDRGVGLRPDSGPALPRLICGPMHSRLTLLE